MSIELLEQIVAENLTANEFAQHRNAVKEPISKYEKAFIHMLKGWLLYSEASKDVNDLTIGDDAVLAASWLEIGNAIDFLLSGPVDRLDRRTLSILINIAIQANGYDDR